MWVHGVASSTRTDTRRRRLTLAVLQGFAAGPPVNLFAAHRPAAADAIGVVQGYRLDAEERLWIAGCFLPGRDAEDSRRST